jgi:hypothetical protein
MNRRGIEFSLMQVEQDVWQWRFQIGETVTTGRTRTRLKGMAVHKAQQRIDIELGKPRELAPARIDSVSGAEAS